ncbi:MAG: hypothetical protein AVDCRST_MAG02-4522, partial [uncultured Rubrobacteraceae bacterium]
ANGPHHRRTHRSRAGSRQGARVGRAPGSPSRRARSQPSRGRRPADPVPIRGRRGRPRARPLFPGIGKGRGRACPGHAGDRRDRFASGDPLQRGRAVPGSRLLQRRRLRGDVRGQPPGAVPAREPAARPRLGEGTDRVHRERHARPGDDGRQDGRGRRGAGRRCPRARGQERGKADLGRQALHHVETSHDALRLRARPQAPPRPELARVHRVRPGPDTGDRADQDVARGRAMGRAHVPDEVVPREARRHHGEPVVLGPRPGPRRLRPLLRRRVRQVLPVQERLADRGPILEGVLRRGACGEAVARLGATRPPAGQGSARLTPI